MSADEKLVWLRSIDALYAGSKIFDLDERMKMFGESRRRQAQGDHDAATGALRDGVLQGAQARQVFQRHGFAAA